MRPRAARFLRVTTPAVLVIAVSMAVVGSAAGSTRSSGIAGFATPAQVEASVKASLALTTLPSDATPSLSTLADNGDWGGDLQYGSKCPLLTTTQYSFTASDCYFGDVKSKFTVALVGDSRARMMLDVMNQLGLDEGFKVLILAKLGCPAAIANFATNNDGTISDTPWPACTDFHTYILSQLAKIKPQVIVVSSILDLQVLTPTPHVATESQVKSDVLAFLKKMPGASHKLVIGGFPQPAPTYNPSLCLSRSPSAIQDCAFKPSTRDVQEYAADAAAAKSVNDTYVTEEPYFCDVTCPAVIGTIIPYTIDAYHADKTYFTYLTDVVWTMIDPSMVKAKF
jgi:hypothetical protein